MTRASGERWPAPEVAVAAVATNDVGYASGNVQAYGDTVVLINALKVKGAGQALKQGTVIRSTRRIGNPEEIDYRHVTIRAWCCEPRSPANGRRHHDQPDALILAQTSGRHCSISASIAARYSVGSSQHPARQAR